MEVRTVQEESDEMTDSTPLVIEKTGLYTPFPVHAYNILAEAKEHAARDVLTCLISHLGYGKKNRMVKPAYPTICRKTGRGRGSVSKGIRTLEEFGFIRKITLTCPCLEDVSAVLQFGRVSTGLVEMATITTAAALWFFL